MAPALRPGPSGGTLMKKLLPLLLSLLLLPGCGPAVPAGADPTASAPDGPASSGAVSAGAEEAERPGTTELVFLLEGEEETVSAALYTGSGYSLYIPTEGWQYERDSEEGVPVDEWKSLDQDEAQLRIYSLGDRTLAQAQDWIRTEEDDYQLLEDRQGGLFGEDAEDQELLEVTFVQADGAIYALVRTYPAEAAEGFGVRLSVLADTFRAEA